ncbi:hypothetical protein [Dyella choica]|uniref:Uncharacterized protein n=1 Tax=Dyella choica TaxID=1927959 RepID=A0A432MB40_9GAMM|nr:hypothetical protein [Dyella choica]RUL79950.1 hypothetical protein EKH80_01795 [Dyella choica]
MKLAVSYDADGTILTMFNPEKMRGADFTVHYVPSKGEKHEVLEVPKDLEAVPFTDLHKVARVNAKNGSARLERHH